MLLTVQSFGFYKFIYLFILFFFLFFFEILLALITIAEIFSFLCFFKTYIVQRQDEAFKISYIDYVHLEGPAADAGLRPGDVIISINGLVVTDLSHNELVALIKSCEEMRMILVFENIRQRIELVARSIRLKKLLNDKLYQLNLLDIQEQAILRRECSKNCHPYYAYSAKINFSVQEGCPVLYKHTFFFQEHLPEKWPTI
ncbi:unnamed protein product [Enterobius vermicularis]|uniref:PDZ domain-containing protein n=1 Tax=Enterobius vermicularis TaxID=51028 RepID=A0A0N4V7T1_ENTVE|nr:unnamed protein product [Enterobius vermicularis]